VDLGSGEIDSLQLQIAHFNPTHPRFILKHGRVVSDRPFIVIRPTIRSVPSPPCCDGPCSALEDQPN
jgi:hypothetical protein